MIEDFSKNDCAQYLKISNSQKLKDNDSISKQQPFNQLPFLFLKPRFLSKAFYTKVGNWNQHENIKYIAFFETKKVRMPLKLFKQMSNFIRTRTIGQCKSHHQKMIQEYKNSDIILQAIGLKNKMSVSMITSKFEKQLCGLAKYSKHQQEIMNHLETGKIQRDSVNADLALDKVNQQQQNLQKQKEPEPTKDSYLAHQQNQVCIKIQNTIFEQNVEDLQNYEKLPQIQSNIYLSSTLQKQNQNANNTQKPNQQNPYISQQEILVKQCKFYYEKWLYKALQLQKAFVVRCNNQIR